MDLGGILLLHTYYFIATQMMEEEGESDPWTECDSSADPLCTETLQVLGGHSPGTIVPLCGDM